MNNVITILVDSVFSECISSRKTKASSTPFIDTLLKDSIYTPNMYSFGPYTNAATKGLYCSVPTLEDYGYYFGINASEYNPYRLFKENGYETYGFYYPYYLISNKTKRHIDHSVYTSGFSFGSMWKGNFEYYQLIKKQRPLNAAEYEILRRFLAMVFDLWLEFYDSILNNAEARLLLDRYTDLQRATESRESLNAQQILFLADERKYVDTLLDMGADHALAKIDCIDFSVFADTDFIKKVIYPQNKDITDYIQRRTRMLNRRNNKVGGRQLLSALGKYLLHRDKEGLRFIYNVACSRNTQRKMLSDTFRGIWQEMPSAKSQIRTAIDMLEQRRTDSPFYLSFHFLEVHERVAYFSYDRQDAAEARKEFETARELAENCGDDFRGSLVYQMALRYIDSCIEELFDYLNRSGLADSTTVMVVADHGSSYTYYPIRENVVNNFHRENYNIPMVIWQKGLQGAGVYEGMYTSMDAYPTLLDVVGLQKPKSWQGKSVRELSRGREYVVTEYMGPGSPDMMTKQAWMSVRNKKYMLAFYPPMNEGFHREKVAEAYDLEHDPLEMKNIAGKIDINDPEISFLIQQVENRFTEICANRDRFIAGLASLEL